VARPPVWVLHLQEITPPDNFLPTFGHDHEAYFGRVTVNGEDNTFVITVESSLVRDLIGQSLKRKWDVSGDTLTLMPEDPAEGWRVTYERQ
jgi:hypothetical protein